MKKSNVDMVHWLNKIQDRHRQTLRPGGRFRNKHKWFCFLHNLPSLALSTGKSASYPFSLDHTVAFR